MKQKTTLKMFVPALWLRIISGGFSFFIGITAVFFALIPVLLGLEEEVHAVDWIFSLSFALFFTYIAVFLALTAFRTRLIVSASGIEYTDMTYSLKCGWDGVERVGAITMGMGEIEGLILKEPMLATNRWFPSTRFFMLLLGTDFSRFINFKQFSRNWRDSELGTEVWRYAPQIFEATPASAQTADAQKRQGYETTTRVREGKSQVLGGWLPLFLVWITIAALFSSFRLIGVVLPAISGINSSPSTSLGMSIPYWQLILFGLADISAIIVAVIASIFFLQAKKAFKIAILIYLLIGFVSGGLIHKTMFFIFYVVLNRSKRVADTFVN